MTKQEFIEQSAMRCVANAFSGGGRYFADVAKYAPGYIYDAVTELADHIYGKEEAE